MNTCLRHAVHCTRISKIDITPAGHRYNFHQNWTPIMRVLLYNSTTNDHYGPCTNPSNIETANWLAAWEHISGHHALTQLNNLKPKLRALQSCAYEPYSAAVLAFGQSSRRQDTVSSISQVKHEPRAGAVSLALIPVITGGVATAANH